MPRTNTSDVQDIFDTDLSAASIDAWIGVATELVDDIADADSSVSSTRLVKIENLVTAHLASSQDQRVEKASRESASVTYQGETGMHFESTHYGQQALLLDPTGTLADMHKPSASIGVPEVKDL